MNRLTFGSALLIALTALGCATTERRSNVDDDDDDDETSTTGDPSGGSTNSGGGFVPPSEVSLQIRETVVRPWDHSNQQWDGATVSAEDIQKLKELLASIDPYLGVAAYIAELANNGWALPDPWGGAELFIDGEWSPDSRALGDYDTNYEDTCVSSWNVGWDHVPVQETMKLHVVLYDEDLQYDDPIGDIELNYSDLIEAVKSNEVFNVQVSDQGSGAVLFVGISVTAQ